MLLENLQGLPFAYRNALLLSHLSWPSQLPVTGAKLPLQVNFLPLLQGGLSPPGCALFLLCLSVVRSQNQPPDTRSYVFVSKLALSGDPPRDSIKRQTGFIGLGEAGASAFLTSCRDADAAGPQTTVGGVRVKASVRTSSPWLLCLGAYNQTLCLAPPPESLLIGRGWDRA